MKHGFQFLGGSRGLQAPEITINPDLYRGSRIDVLRVYPFKSTGATDRGLQRQPFVAGVERGATFHKTNLGLAILLPL